MPSPRNVLRVMTLQLCLASIQSIPCTTVPHEKLTESPNPVHIYVVKINYGGRD